VRSGVYVVVNRYRRDVGIPIVSLPTTICLPTLKWIWQVDLARTNGFDKNDAHSYGKTSAVLAGKTERPCMDCHKICVPPSDRRRNPHLHSDACGY
jgi:hypothetical protein